MRELHAHAAQHHGAFSRDEARVLGVSDQRLARQIANGAVLQLAPRVFGVAGSPDSWFRRARVASLSAGGILSHRSAAALHGIDGYSEGVIEVVVPKTRRPRTGAVRVHRSTQFDLIYPETRNGLDVTDVPRTILDLGAVVSLRRLEGAIDAVLRQKLCAWHELMDVLIRHSIQGRNGCGPLRALIDQRAVVSPIPDSAWNRMVGRLLESAGLPTPRYEFTVRDASDRFVGRVDLAYPRQRIAIELDSVRWHLNRESFELDPRRKNALTIAGWTVLTFTWADYTERPEVLVRTVRAALTA